MSKSGDPAAHSGHGATPSRPATGRSVREVRTVVFTDIVGSTDRALALGDAAWSEVLGQHRRLAEERLRAGGGQQLESTGDGYLSVFKEPSQAVLAVRSFQQVVRRELDLHLRAAIHTGEIERHRPRGFAGIAVNIASRVLALAEAGEVLVTNTVRELSVGSGIRYVPRGEHRLRGVEGAWSLYAVRSIPRSAPEETPAGGPVTRGGKQSRGISVLLVDDHPLWRETLRQVLVRSRVGSIVGSVGTLAEGIEVAGSAQPSVVVLDEHLPDGTGSSAVARILQAAPSTAVVMLSSSEDPSSVRAAITAGANGYLLKTAEPRELVDAVRRVAGGEFVVPPALVHVLRSSLRAAQPGADPGIA